MNNNKTDIPVQESDYTFIQEKIKERPLNKRKLLKKLLFTAGTAIVFGAVACVTFMCLEPLLGSIVSSDEETALTQIVLPETAEPEQENYDVTVSSIPFEETPIEDMTFTDSSDIDDMNVISELIREESPEPYELNLEEYQKLCKQLYSMSNEVNKSLVTITAVTEDMDLLNANHVSTNITCGCIIAETESAIFIGADGRNIDDDSTIMVTFCNGEVYEGELVKKDSETKLAVYKVLLRQLSSETKDAYTVATFGSSTGSVVIGSAIIAVGNPMALNTSVCYGNITSNDGKAYVEDSTYQLLTTDIYGSQNGYGFLVNVRGQFIGIITQDHHSSDMQNLIYAYGMSGVRNLLEDLSNEKAFAHLGISVVDVTAEASIAYDMPSGAYVTDVKNSSPAMNVGITAGDIITGFNEYSVSSVADYMMALRDLEPGDDVTLTFYRFSAGEYKETVVETVADER